MGTRATALSAAATLLVLLPLAPPHPAAHGRTVVSAPAELSEGAQPALRGEPPLPSMSGTPLLDVILLVGLMIVLWSLRGLRQRTDEDSILRASYYDQLPLPHLPLRAVTYPSEADAERLRMYRGEWIREFMALQNAWSRHDLPSVASLVTSEVLGELETAERAADGQPGASAAKCAFHFSVRMADPADSWTEDGWEFVTVHFAGLMRAAEHGHGVHPFDEYWLFRRAHDVHSAEAGPWVVTGMRSGNRQRSLPRLADASQAPSRSADASSA